jgi:hypothetical protein
MKSENFSRGWQGLANPVSQLKTQTFTSDFNANPDRLQTACFALQNRFFEDNRQPIGTRKSMVERW